MKATNYLILILTILILMPAVMADGEQYLTWGVSRDSSFQQDGNGVWTEVTGVTYTRAETYTSYPLVEDVDNDGTNEIIIMKNETLHIYNYTTGVGLLEEASLGIGSTNYDASGSRPYYLTPGLIDYDSDDYTEIILFNRTHAITTEWNTTALHVEQSATHHLTPAVGFSIALFPIVKCAPGAQWATGNDTCLSPIRGLSTSLCGMAYDLDANTVNNVSDVCTTSDDPARHGTHLADGDSDGFLEMYHVFDNAANDILDIYEYELSSTGTLSIALVYRHDLVSGTTDFTDIIVNNLDGNLGDGMEITWGYTADGTNWDACTVNADTGAVDECDYCGLTTCPEGESSSSNLVVASDTTYCDFSGDVYYYIRNAANNDPGLNTDTVFCVSRFAGSGFKETEVSNTQNFTSTSANPFFIHQTNMYGTVGILTSLFGISGASKQTVPAITSQSLLIPVDVQKSGSVDVIGVVPNTRLTYYDDAYTNAQWQITSLGFDTGNPVCENEIVTFTVTVEDDEDDVGTCFFTEKYGNNTIITNGSNASRTAPGSVSLYYNADAVGTFLLDFNCHDQFNRDSFDTETYTVSISNDTTTCNKKGEGADEIDLDPDTTTTEDEELEEDISNMLCDSFFLCGNKAKNVVGVFIIFLVCLGAFLKTRSESITIAAGIGGALICFLIGILSILPLVIIVISLIALTVFRMSKQGV